MYYYDVFEAEKERKNKRKRDPSCTAKKNPEFSQLEKMVKEEAWRAAEEDLSRSLAKQDDH